MATYPLKSPHLPLSFFGQIFCLPSPRLWRHALGLCFLVTLLGLGLNWRLLGFTSSEASPLALTLILFVIFLATLARLGFGGVTLFLVFSASLLLYLPASIDLSLPLYFWLLPLFLFWMSALSANLDVGLYRNWKGQSLFFLGAGVFLCVLAGHHTPYFFIFIVTLVLYLICALRASLTKRSLFLCTLLPCLLGYFLFAQIPFWKATSEAPQASQYTLMHTMVLSLGLDQSSTMQKGRLFWGKDDTLDADLPLAPSLTLYSKNADPVLFHYYIYLWKTHFSDMGRLYLKRLLTQQTAISLKKPPLQLSSTNALYLKPLKGIDTFLFGHGWSAHLIFIGCTLLLWRRKLIMPPALLFVLLTLSVSAEFIMIESLLIYPLPNAYYFSIPTFAGYFFIIIMLSSLVTPLQQATMDRMKK